MALINLKDHGDPFYRYKMPLFTKGRFHMFNIEAIAESIYRKPKDIVQYLQKQMGMSIKLEGKFAKTTAVLNAEVIQNYIFEYIEKFVLCKNCGSPETMPRCNSCGFQNKFV